MKRVDQFRKDFKSVVTSGRRNPKRKVLVVPDQAMSLETILDRYTRQMPVVATQRDAVYLDQHDHDLEAAARGAALDKQEFAIELKDERERMERELSERDVRKKEAERKKREEREAASSSSEKSTGLESLDNTRPDDTKHTTK